MVAALYVRNESIYKTMRDVDAWDIARDATRYRGPHAIIAHPPCGHWGKYRHSCKLPGKHCLNIALSQVREFGGVLEHPVGSALFLHIARPRQPDLWGGMTMIIDQCDYGHLAPKRTIIYYVRCTPPPQPASRSAARTCESLSRKQRESTPPALAAWLYEFASSRT